MLNNKFLIITFIVGIISSAFAQNWGALAWICVAGFWCSYALRLEMKTKGK